MKISMVIIIMQSGLIAIANLKIISVKLFWPYTDHNLQIVGWVASMSIIGTLFVLIKFILYYASKYKAYKSAEKEFEKVNY